MPLEIDQDGPIGLTVPKGPVVDAEHLGDGHTRKGQTTPQAQKSVAADGQAQAAAKRPRRPPAPRRCAPARARVAVSAEPREPRAMTAARSTSGVDSGHWRNRIAAHGGGARHAMVPRGGPPRCEPSGCGYAASETGKPDSGPAPVSRSPATSAGWRCRPCARRRGATGVSWEQVSQKCHVYP